MCSRYLLRCGSLSLYRSRQSNYFEKKFQKQMVPKLYVLIAFEHSEMIKRFWNDGKTILLANWTSS